jgi:hypothetical protein
MSNTNILRTEKPKLGFILCLQRKFNQVVTEAKPSLLSAFGIKGLSENKMVYLELKEVHFFCKNVKTRRSKQSQSNEIEWFVD